MSDARHLTSVTASRGCLVRYKCNERLLAAASIYQDVQNLEAVLTLEALGAYRKQQSHRRRMTRRRVQCH
jgi:hypothetical protein